MKSTRDNTGFPMPVAGHIGRVGTDRPAMLRLKAKGLSGTPGGGESTVKKLKASK